MAEINDKMEFADSTPQEAAENIDMSNFFDTTPDTVKEMKDEFKPDFEKALRPSSATRTVSQYVAKSPEHAALVKNDIDKLSKAEVTVTKAAEKMKGVDKEQEYADLLYKQKKDPNNFSVDDEIRLVGLEMDVKERSQYKDDKPGKHQELIDKTAEGNKELSFFESAYKSLQAAGYSFNVSFLRTGALAYDILTTPYNFIQKQIGGEQVKTPEFLTNNSILNDQTQKLKSLEADAPKITASVSDAVSKGNYAEAGEIAALQFLRNAPNMALMIASGSIAGPIIAATTTAADAAQEARDKGIDPLTGTAGSVAKGGFEAVFEKLGTFSALKKWETSLTASYGKDAASKVLLNTFKSIAGSAAQEGIEEGATNIAQELTDYVTGMNPDALKNLPKTTIDSAIGGAISGGLMVGPTAAMQASRNIQDRNRIKSLEQKSVEILSYDQSFTKMMSEIDSTEMAKLAPGEKNKLVRQMLQDNGIKDVYVDKDELTQAVKTKEAADKIIKLISPKGKEDAKSNAPIRMDAHEFMQLRGEFPEVGDIARLKPDAPNVKEAKQFLEELNASNDKQRQILSRLGATDITPEEQATIDQALNTEQPSRVYPSSDPFGEQEYLNQPTFTEAIASVTPDKQLQKFNDAQKAARQSVVDGINEASQLEMNEIIDITQMEAMDAEYESQLARLEDNPNLAIVDKFTKTFQIRPDNRYAALEDMKANHAAEGFSPLAIDPRSLPEHLQKYLKDPQIKAHKVFVKGGISADYSASLLGLDSGEALLRIMSQTPTREQVAQARTEARKADVEQNARDSVNVNETALVAAYNNNTRNHLEELKYMISSEWAQTKWGIKKIALRLPKIEELSYRAKRAVSKTKVGELSVAQYKRGEVKSQRIAVDAILKNEVQKAFTNKEAAALNSEMQKETQIAIGLVNRVIKSARKFKKADVMQELKDAGPQYVELAEAILSNFDLTSSKSKANALDSYRSFVKKAAEGHDGKLFIPDDLLETRKPIQDMTVEEALMIGDALTQIRHMAKTKNKLMDKYNKIKDIKYLDSVAAQVQQKAEKVFDYDLTRNENKQDSLKSDVERFGELLIETKSSFERSQHVISKLDNGQTNGYFNDMFWRPLVDAGNESLTLSVETKKQLEKIFDKFGREEFQNLAAEKVYVEEFKNVPGLEKGNISKAQLLAMELNFGNEGNIIALERFGVSREELRAVLDKHLDHKHTELAQNIWNVFESFKPKMQDLQKRTNGTDVRWVQARPFEARGRLYPGGYYPISYQFDSVKQNAQDLQGAAELRAFENFRQKYYAEAMTDQGHLEARTGSDSLVELNLHVIGHSINQVIHDLTHREVIRDGAKLLSDKRIREQMIAVIGKEGYDNIAHTYVSTARQMEDQGYDRTTSGLNKFINHLMSGAQATSIGYNLSSILIQPASVAFAVNKMGKIKGTYHIARTIGKLVSNPTDISKLYTFAEQLDPGLRAFREDVENSAAQSINKLLPNKKYLYSPLVTAKEIFTEGAKNLLAYMDMINKTIILTSAYSQAINGDAEGVGKSHEDAVKYATNVAEATLTYNASRNLSPIQRSKQLRGFLLYFNDINNVYNNMIGEARKVKSSLANKEHLKAVTTAASFAMLLMFVKYYEQLIRGYGTFLDDKKTPEEAAKATAKFFVTSSIDSVVGTLPLGRDISYAIQKWSQNKTVDMPLDSVLGSFANAYVGIQTMIGMSDSDEVTEIQKKALFTSFGILTNSPTTAIYKYFFKDTSDKKSKTNLLGLTPDFSVDQPAEKKGIIDQTVEAIDSFINKKKDSVSEQFIEEMKQVKNDLQPAEASDIPQDFNKLVAHIESKGNHLASNPNSSATGLYQFTEGTWNSIKEQAPELGLTDEGRIKPEQQEKAMNYLTKQNIEKLSLMGIDINNVSLYAAHFLGVDKASDVLLAKNDAKVKDFVDKDVLKANGLAANIRVSEFKKWISEKLKQAESEIDKPNN